MTYNPNTAQRAMTPVERAQHHAARARDRSRELHGLLSAVRHLFGPSVAYALEHPVEEVTEHVSEANYHYQQVVDDLQARLGRALAQRDAAGEVARQLQHELLARYRKANRPAPDWLIEGLNVTQHPAAEEPF